MQQEAFEKLSGLLKKLKDHDSTLFQANGITLIYGEKFHHDFNVEHIASVETKQLQVSREMETLKEKKKTFEQIFKGLQGKSVSKKRKLKENRRKSKDRKCKRFENNVRGTYHICVANPFAIKLPHCLLYPPSLTIPEACVNMEDVAMLLLKRDAPCIAYLLQETILAWQEAGCSPILSRTLGTGCTASCILKIMVRKTRVMRKESTIKWRTTMKRMTMTKRKKRR